MCGIAGVVSPDPARRSSASRMVDALMHRGPDDRGTLELGDVSLGSTRLGIQDPANGRQPMLSRDGAIAVVFNGEIYNYPILRRTLERVGAHFRTHCDTEIILHLYRRYGQRFVERLEGMFAIAVWDTTRRRLMLARDHMGQKPMFYCRIADGLAFASEAKALFASGLATPRLDLETLYHYVSLRFVPSGSSLFAGIASLPAAHYLVYENRTIEVQPYWHLDCREKLTGSQQEVVEELDHRFSNTVANHLLSDVSVGAFLSGGIDSSLITAMMAYHGEAPPPTFSIGVRERSFDELPYARAVARRFACRHHEKVVGPDLVSLLPDMVWHLEEPADPFAVGIYLVSSLASEHVKVVLSGDGGDELFAGYDRYSGQRAAGVYAALPAVLREQLFSRLIDTLPDRFTYNSSTQKLRWIQAMARVDNEARYARSLSFLRFTEETKRRLFSERARRELGDLDSTFEILRHYESKTVDDLVDRMLYTDLMTRIPNHLLPIVDRMAMAHGLEVRCPFMEHEMVEFGMRIPGRMKLKRGKQKHVLRLVAAKYLDSDIVQRKKQGFGFPLAFWMQGELQGLLERTFHSSSLVESGVLSHEYMTELLEEHISGHRDHNYRLWMILNLEIWHRTFFGGESREEVRTWLADSSAVVNESMLHAMTRGD